MPVRLSQMARPANRARKRYFRSGTYPRLASDILRLAGPFWRPALARRRRVRRDPRSLQRLLDTAGTRVDVERWHYCATGAQWNDSDLSIVATAEHRYVLPLQVAFHVPLPSVFAATFDRTFSSGTQPVYPALTVFSFSWTIGDLTDTQPLAPATMVTRKAFQTLCIFTMAVLGKKQAGRSEI